MRNSKLRPTFPGFDVDSNNNVHASYLNLYSDNILDDWNAIIDCHHIGMDSRLDKISISYEDDGSLRDLLFTFILQVGNGFKYYWVQLRPSRKLYLITSSLTEQCPCFNDLLETNDFLHTWSHLDLKRMKPTGDFAWFEFDFFGKKVSYACEDTTKYYISGNEFSPFKNDSLPVTGYFITSYGMVRNNNDKLREVYEGKGYIDYFFYLS